MSLGTFLTKNLVIIRVPMWFFILMVCTPIFAYGDLIISGHKTFVWYLYASVAEIILIFIGFLIASGTSAIERRKNK